VASGNAADVSVVNDVSYVRASEAQVRVSVELLEGALSAGGRRALGTARFSSTPQCHSLASLLGRWMLTRQRPLASQTVYAADSTGLDVTDGGVSLDALFNKNRRAFGSSRLNSGRRSRYGALR